MKIAIPALVAVAMMTLQTDTCVSNPDEAAQLRILVTDAGDASVSREGRMALEKSSPAGSDDLYDAEQIMVVIKEVSVLQIGEDGDGTWHIVSDEIQTVDLVLLAGGGLSEIGLADLPDGRYNQIRLLLTDSWIVIDGIEYPVKIPSSASSGLKIQGEFNMEEGVSTSVTLDFDADESLSYNNGNGYMLTPVIKVHSVEYEPIGDDAPPDVEAPGDDDATELPGEDPTVPPDPATTPTLTPTPAPDPATTPTLTPTPAPDPATTPTLTPAPDVPLQETPTPAPTIPPGT